MRTHTYAHSDCAPRTNRFPLHSVVFSGSLGRCARRTRFILTSHGRKTAAAAAAAAFVHDRCLCNQAPSMIQIISLKKKNPFKWPHCCWLCAAAGFPLCRGVCGQRRARCHHSPTDVDVDTYIRIPHRTVHFTITVCGYISAHASVGVYVCVLTHAGGKCGVPETSTTTV